MNYLKRRPREKTWFQSPAVMALLGLFCLVMVLNTMRVYFIFRSVAAEEYDLRAEIYGKEQQIHDLHSKLKMLESGEGLELEARARLNFQKPDEEVLIIVDDSNSRAGTATSTSETFFSRIKKWFSDF